MTTSSIPGALRPRLDLFNDEPAPWTPMPQGQAALDAIEKAAAARTQLAQSPMGQMIDALADTMYTPPDWRKLPQDLGVKRPAVLSRMVRNSFYDVQEARTRARWMLGLPVVQSAQRRYRYDGLYGQAMQRLDAYAEFSPRQRAKMPNGGVAGVVMANRMGLGRNDDDVATKLLEMNDQALATCLAAVHPKRLRNMFEAGISQDPSYIDRLPALIAQWAEQDGPVSRS